MRNGLETKLEPKPRLIDGMTQAAGRHGYAGATVARVVEQAGVSRATFYEHFADKEACFLAAFEQAAEPIELALGRIEASHTPQHRAAAFLDDLLAYVVHDPAAARVLLVEAMAGGTRAREARERLSLRLEETLERWLDWAGKGGIRLTVSGRAIIEGTAGILVIRSFRGETARLAEIRDDLLTWINSYVVLGERPRLNPDQWRQLGAGLVRERPARLPARGGLPRGKSAATPEVVAANQRERILDAVAVQARHKTYAGTTVADVVKAAGVTREAFYDLFRSKEDAFLAAQNAGLEASVSQAAACFFCGADWPSRVWDGLEALLGYLAQEPDLVYVEIIESYAAGPAAIRRSFDNRMAYTLFLEDGYRENSTAEGRPRLCSEAIAAAILGLMRWQVREGRTERMMELLPQAAFVALAPFVGPAAAIELVEAKAAAGGPPAA
ncbi:MAG TPA: TetR/AcrR family transcriptional regulator [Solirubrobacterales bacterium]|nr:TetR/AcrR family transcriptional regulator [Solirubrobacterales bacterium]